MYVHSQRIRKLIKRMSDKGSPPPDGSNKIGDRRLGVSSSACKWCTSSVKLLCKTERAFVLSCQDVHLYKSIYLKFDSGLGRCNPIRFEFSSTRDRKSVKYFKDVTEEEEEWKGSKVLRFHFGTLIGN